MTNKAVVVRGWVSGLVQGVGFRWHVRDCAGELGVTGYAVNLPDGGVEVLLSGAEEAVDMVQRAVVQGSVRARVDQVIWQREDEIDFADLPVRPDAGRSYTAFTIG